MIKSNTSKCNVLILQESEIDVLIELQVEGKKVYLSGFLAERSVKGSVVGSQLMVVNSRSCSGYTGSHQ